MRPLGSHSRGRDVELHRSFLWFIAAMQNRSSGQRANFMTNKHGRTHPFQAVAPTQNLSEASTPGWACMLSPNLWGGGGSGEQNSFLCSTFYASSVRVDP